MLVSLGFVAVNLCGCLFFVASLGESYKVKENLNVSYGKAIDIVQEALGELKMGFQKAIIKPDIAVVKARYTDERTAYIRIFKEGENASRIEIRVGTDETGKADARKILETIQLCLSK